MFDTTLINIKEIIKSCVRIFIYKNMPEKPLYKPFVSSAKNKKYSVYVKSGEGRRLIHFGDKRYEHYRDKLGHYSSKNHLDKTRRKAYYARHGPAPDKNTAKYWSHKILW